MTTLYTIGYQGRSVNDLLVTLFEADVESLVDVRLRPQSRKPGFSKTSLGNALREQDIDYTHVRELGTPLDIRGIMRAGRYEEGHALYRKHLLENAADELAWLADHARKQPTAILCFELAARECHRRVVAEELQRLHGFEVEDL